MHNLELIRRRFPRHGNRIIAAIAGLSLIGVITGGVILALS